MNSRVFIIEPYDKVNVNPARDYGDLVYLFPLDGDRCSVWDEEFSEELLKRLRTYRYDPTTDFIAVVGPMATVAIAIAAIAINFDDIHLLVFSAVDREYVPYSIGVPA